MMRSTTARETETLVNNFDISPVRARTTASSTTTTMGRDIVRASWLFYKNYTQLYTIRSYLFSL